MRSDTPSDTATLVARSILVAARDERLSKLVAEGEEAVLEAILGSGGQPLWLTLAIEKRWARTLLLRFERWVLPGIIAHYLVRKRRIERWVREAMTQGVQQLVVVGAGFDALGWRLHLEFPKLVVIEVDHPATQEMKRCSLEVSAGFHLQPADLSSRSLAESLEECSGYSARRKTVFVAEGVTMYFLEREVRAIMQEFSKVSGSSVIFTFMEEDENGSYDFRGQQGLVASWLRWRKEPFQWGITRGRLPEFLHDCGLEQHAVRDHHALRAEILEPRGLEDIPLARGECLCLCSPIE